VEGCYFCNCFRDFSLGAPLKSCSNGDALTDAAGDGRDDMFQVTLIIYSYCVPPFVEGCCFCNCFRDLSFGAPLKSCSDGDALTDAAGDETDDVGDAGGTTGRGAGGGDFLSVFSESRANVPSASGGEFSDDDELVSDSAEEDGAEASFEALVSATTTAVDGFAGLGFAAAAAAATETAAAAAAACLRFFPLFFAPRCGTRYPISLRLTTVVTRYCSSSFQNNEKEDGKV